MADESPPGAVVGESRDGSSSQVQPRYEGLRWAIRITGIILMFGGTIYLGITASRLLTDHKSGNGLFLVVGSLITLGLGIFVLRIGFAMLRTINRQTIGSFSFLFALIYTFILIQILPVSGILNDYPIMLYLCVFLYFGLTYWVLKSILFNLLLPRQ